MGLVNCQKHVVKDIINKMKNLIMKWIKYSYDHISIKCLVFNIHKELTAIIKRQLVLTMNKRTHFLCLFDANTKFNLKNMCTSMLIVVL